eukprot:gene4941-8538_t
MWCCGESLKLEIEQRTPMIQRVDIKQSIKTIKNSILEQLRFRSEILRSTNEEDKKKYEEKLQRKKIPAKM